jgi:hypothetical protein
MILHRKVCLGKNVKALMVAYPLRSKLLLDPVLKKESIQEFFY